jgi:hypothetical protein
MAIRGIILILVVMAGCASVSIDTSILNDSTKLEKADFCFDNYAELLYLVQKDYPNADYAAFKAAYSLMNTESNYDFELDNLVIQAYYASSSDMLAWNRLSNKEKEALFKYLDESKPLDWPSVRNMYKSN